MLVFNFFHLVLKLLIRRFAWTQQPVTQSGHQRSLLKSPRIQTTKVPLSTLYLVGVQGAPLSLGCTSTLPHSHRTRRKSQLRQDWRYLVSYKCLVVISTRCSLFFGVQTPISFVWYMLLYVLIVILGLHFVVAKQLMQLSACVLQEVNTLVCTLLLSYLPH